jgi:phosphotransferase system enzyme I (PtsI)
MKGIGVSPGISIGRAFVIKRSADLPEGIIPDPVDLERSELERFDQAVRTSIEEVESIITNHSMHLQEEEVEILKMQIGFLKDQRLRADLLDEMQQNRTDLHNSLLTVIGRFIQMFRDMDEECMNKRSADIQDVGNRILKHLNRSVQPVRSLLKENTIIIADNVLSVEEFTKNMKHIIGFVTRNGSKAHATMLSKTIGIPAVVSCGDRIDLIKNDDTIIIDGKEGRVLINPDQGRLEEYKRLNSDHLRMSEALSELSKNKNT